MVQYILYAIGAVLVAVGALGFVNDPVAGIFEVDMVHNLVHLITGALVLVAGYLGDKNGGMLALVLGVVYGAVALLGFVMGGDMILGLFEANMADHYLHVALAVVLIGTGWMGVQANATGPMPKPNKQQQQEPMQQQPPQDPMQ